MIGNEILADGVRGEDAPVSDDGADEVGRRDVEGRIVAVNAVNGGANCAFFSSGIENLIRFAPLNRDV